MKSGNNYLSSDDHQPSENAILLLIHHALQQAFRPLLDQYAAEYTTFLSTWEREKRIAERQDRPWPHPKPEYDSSHLDQTYKKMRREADARVRNNLLQELESE